MPGWENHEIAEMIRLLKSCEAAYQAGGNQLQGLINGQTGDRIAALLEKASLENRTGVHTDFKTDETMLAKMREYNDKLDFSVASLSASSAATTSESPYGQIPTVALRASPSPNPYGRIPQPLSSTLASENPYGAIPRGRPGSGEFSILKADDDDAVEVKAASGVTQTSAYGVLPKPFPKKPEPVYATFIDPRYKKDPEAKASNAQSAPINLGNFGNQNPAPQSKSTDTVLSRHEIELEWSELITDANKISSGELTHKLSQLTKETKSRNLTNDLGNVFEAVNNHISNNPKANLYAVGVEVNNILDTMHKSPEFKKGERVQIDKMKRTLNTVLDEAKNQSQTDIAQASIPSGPERPKIITRGARVRNLSAEASTQISDKFKSSVQSARDVVKKDQSEDNAPASNSDRPPQSPKGGS